MFRTIKLDGRAFILEFSKPPNRVIRFFYSLYLRHVVPMVGFFLTGHKSAYRYLNQTIEEFPCGRDFCVLMEETGFRKVKAHPLTFGIATIYQGDKLKGLGS